MSALSANISDDLIFSHWPLFSKLFASPAVNFLFSFYTLLFPPFLSNFSISPCSSSSPYFQMLLHSIFFPLQKCYISFPLNWQKHLFPPKMPNFSLKWKLWKFLLLFPPWNGRHCLGLLIKRTEVSSTSYPEGNTRESVSLWAAYVNYLILTEVQVVPGFPPWISFSETFKSFYRLNKLLIC